MEKIARNNQEALKLIKKARKGDIIILDERECKRCGICCMSLPNWEDLPNLDRAFIRLYDREAEELFKKVKEGKCPYLIFEGIRAKCLIYDKRFKFCRAYKCKK
jgi:Fe-S-cluster containining protein